MNGVAFLAVIVLNGIAGILQIIKANIFTNPRLKYILNIRFRKKLDTFEYK